MIVKNMPEQNIYNKIDNYLEQLLLRVDKVVYVDKKPIKEMHSSKKNENIDLSEKKMEQNTKPLFNISAGYDILKHEPEWKKSSSIDELYSKIHNCTNCPLGLTRKNFVFGSGNPNAKLVVIGEAPGADEDEQGLPFVGRAGQLLTKILESIGLQRSDVYICNILKCRPPGNRVPLTSEVDECMPYLLKQIELIQPSYILALGLTAANNLLNSKYTMAEIHGKLYDFHGTPMLVTYHPSALLRNPNLKKPTWEDMKYLRTLLDEAVDN
jgi:uracil-DNA glycosylase